MTTTAATGADEGRRGLLASLPALGLNEVVAPVAAVLFLNGVTRMVVDHVSTHGFVASASATFGISAVVWVSMAIALSMTSEPGEPASPRDVKVGLAGLAACLIPTETACWVALTLLAAYAIRRSPAGTAANRGAWILLGVTVPVFWSKAVFFLLIDHLLTADAALASLMLNSQRVGNTVRTADDSGFLWIAPACSSFANMSLAVLCWMTILRLRRLRATTRRVMWCVAACAAVMAVNAVRIALIGYFPAWYEFLHQGGGATIIGWVTLAVILLVCSYGIGHGDRAQA